MTDRKVLDIYFNIRERKCPVCDEPFTCFYSGATGTKENGLLGHIVQKHDGVYKNNKLTDYTTWENYYTTTLYISSIDVLFDITGG